MNTATAEPDSSIELRAYTTRALSKIYGVDERTFKKWLQPFNSEIGEKQGYYFTIAQVKIILEKIGLP
ncbi:hypothetical protein HGH93_11970 [Chitinophaga polysaccharea]|uniref:hypothetical protein n=1 Tax=Chitinophaga polysaccharea TaxID=1293035 RepID=UPI00145542BF|nr:hypothetical protein [Chitinophaga polysaccharea]NLR58823.1 hypothetical protein [Chitinophaga polysaccharea]